MKLRSLLNDLGASAMLALFSAASMLVCVRVFNGWDFVPDVVLIVVVGHGLSLFLRRAGFGVWAVFPLLILVVTWLLAARYYSDTTGVFWIPTGETLGAVRSDLLVIRSDFPTERAPVDYAGVWAVLTGLGTALVVVLSDGFAFGAKARAESLVPGGVLFVFVSALGDGGGGVVLAALVVAIGVVTATVLRRTTASDPPVITGSTGRLRSSLLPASACVALCVAAIAAVLGPSLPGAGAPPLYETSGRSGGVTEVISPLVDIRTRLVQQSENEVFRVTATAESYWRVTTLPEFDGSTFRLPTRPLERTDGRLGTGRPGSLEIRQNIEISALGGRLVPAAADPVEASGAGLRWNPDTSTLVTVNADLARGDVFEVVSQSPRVDPAQLRAVARPAPPDPIHLSVPEGFPSSVAATAQMVAGSAPTQYDAALALQSWFRTEFTYSLDVPPGHGNSAIETFLSQRIGYCEQFSASFAAMARTLGIPSRVAVGYTSGNRLPDGSYSVLGRHAHAWPELWFGDLGWVPFEPTPGRGAPGTEQYTGVAPEQDSEPASENPEGETPEPTTPPSAEDSSTDQVPVIPEFGDPSAGQSGDGSSSPIPVLEDAARSPRLLLALAALGALAAAPAGVRKLRQRVSERRPAQQQVHEAWHTAKSAVQRVGVSGQASMTSSEWARATAHTLPLAARPMSSLAAVVETVNYAPPGTVDLETQSTFGVSLARDCSVWARQVESVADGEQNTLQRLAAYFLRW